MAVHSYRVLKERFAETRSLHRHDAEQQVWAVPNKLLQGKGLCIYKDIACKRASAYQNGTTKHCLQKLLHPSELSIPLAAVILDSSKIFQEARCRDRKDKFKSEIDPAVFTAQTAPNIFCFR